MLDLIVKPDVAAVAAPGTVIGRPFLVNAYTSSEQTPVTHFDQPFQMTLHFDEGLLGGVDETSLRLLYLDEAAGLWRDSAAVPDWTTNVLTVELNHAGNRLSKLAAWIGNLTDLGFLGLITGAAPGGVDRDGGPCPRGRGMKTLRCCRRHRWQWP